MSSHCIFTYLHYDVIRHLMVQTWFAHFSFSVQPLYSNFGIECFSLSIFSSTQFKRRSSTKSSKTSWTSRRRWSIWPTASFNRRPPASTGTEFSTKRPKTCPAFRTELFERPRWLRSEPEPETRRSRRLFWPLLDRQVLDFSAPGLDRWFSWKCYPLVNPKLL